MKREFTIGNKTINDQSDAYVIAEVGNNHQGELDKCIELFQAAKQSGADAVKLQKRDNKAIFTQAAYDKPYDNENSFGKTYGEHRDFLEFGKQEYAELAKVSKELGIDFFATAFDFNSADFLAALDMPLYKIASADLTNVPLIKHIAGFGKPMIISTGGATMEDVQRVYDAIMPINSNICFLQCTATYPTEAEDLHLNVLTTFREKFPEVVVGLSDHFNGISMATAAFVLGGRVFEKHFTLNHTWKGTDHALSLEPIGMGKMVRDLQRVRVALGSPEKQCLEKEAPAVVKMGKSVVAAGDLAAGTTLSLEDLVLKTPAGGIPPYQLDDLVGKTLQNAVAKDAMLKPEDLG